MLKPELEKRLEKFLSENEMMGKPATSEQIAMAEKELSMKLPEDYVDFISKFGGAYAGVEIYAFEENEDIVSLTKQLRNDFGGNDERHAEAAQSVVIADDGSGNPIIINAKGEVVIFYHDCDERETLASSLSEFIEENFEEW